MSFVVLNPAYGEPGPVAIDASDVRAIRQVRCCSVYGRHCLVTLVGGDTVRVAGSVEDVAERVSAARSACSMAANKQPGGEREA